ncbi:mechanosensitive ion channel protein MscS [Sphingobium sp. SCG-1]|uniref:mechanosensitive ion channel family protein n=1 Tax=Sphingobium sp. SCG-1 TaxID=2072936 RepID=UPI000CD68BF6|nr:mechanosensitive ion channel domain-containing protein [Sphingobium sp. SCG-1]AUW59252.1 mechanosensitive ion channel protein MscS [Sphingobium sp. SCG-1]
MPAADKSVPKEPLVKINATPPDLHEMWRSTLHWFDLHGLEILIACGAGLLIYLGLGALKHLAQRLRDREGDSSSLMTVIGRAFSRTTHFFRVMVAARLVAGYANPPDLLMRTITFLFTVATVFQGAIWLREIIIGLIERRTADDGSDTLTNAMGIIRLLVTVALFSIAIIVVLDNLGVNVTGLVAGLGVGGIAIGLAAQGIFSDLFAALSIIFDKPFRRGETIHYDQTTATVEKIGLKSTRLRAVTGERKVISNANLLQKEITNYQHLDHRRIKFAFGLIYQTDPDHAERVPDIVRDIVESLDGKFIRCGMINFGASSLDYEVEFDVYLPDWDSIYKVRHKVAIAMLKRFAKERLEFAYPTQTTFTADPEGKYIMPYPSVMPVSGIKS